MKEKGNGLHHATPRIIDGIAMPWPIDEKDLSKMRAQVKRYPANVWPCRFAAEWDLTESTARKIIKESK